MHAFATTGASLATHSVSLVWITASIILYAAPSGIAVPVQLGEPVTLLCRATGMKNHRHVVWHRGHQSTSELGERFHVNRATGSLTISKVQLEDEGNYTCSASKGRRFKPFTAALEVSTVPQITEVSSPSKPDVGQHVIIFCKTSGRPRPSVVWYSSQDRLINLKDPDEHGSRFSIREHKSGDTVLESYLSIAPVLPVDRGAFVCMATNAMRSVPSTVYLDVQESAKLLFPQENMLIYWWEGHHVNLTCQAKGNPAPDLIWKSFDENGGDHRMPLTPVVSIRNGVTTSSTITLPTTKSFHLPAVFKCHAKNIYGETQPRQFEVREGSVPPAPVIEVVSIKDDELVLSVDIPSMPELPPVRYVTAHYRLREATQNMMEESTTFTGNDTRLALRGIMLSYHYVINVKAVNIAGSSESTQLKIHAEIMPTTTPSNASSSDFVDSLDSDANTGIEPQTPQVQAASNEHTEEEVGRSLQSTMGNNSSFSLSLSWLCAVVVLFSIISRTLA